MLATKSENYIDLIKQGKLKSLPAMNLQGRRDSEPNPDQKVDNHLQIKLELDFELNNKSASKFEFTTPSLDFKEHSLVLQSQLTLLKEILKSYPSTNLKLGQDYLTIFNKLTKPRQKRMKPEFLQEPMKSDHSFDITLSNTEKSLYFYFRGELYRLIRSFNEAKQNLERSIKLNPRNEDAWYAMGKLLISLNQVDEAREAFEFILDLKSTNHRVYYRLAQIQQLVGGVNTIDLYKQSVRIEPRFAKGWFGLGIAMFNQYQESENLQDVRMCISALNQAEKLGFQDLKLNETRGKCYQLLDKIDFAILDYSASQDKTLKRQCANLLKYKRELSKIVVKRLIDFPTRN